MWQGIYKEITDQIRWFEPIAIPLLSRIGSLGIQLKRLLYIVIEVGIDNKVQFLFLFLSCRFEKLSLFFSITVLIIL